MRWVEFEALEPDGYGASYNAALICSVVANVNRKPRTKPFKPEDFLPTRKSSKTFKPMSAESFAEKLDRIKATMTKKKM